MVPERPSLTPLARDTFLGFIVRRMGYEKLDEKRGNVPRAMISKVDVSGLVMIVVYFK